MLDAPVEEPPGDRPRHDISRREIGERMFAGHERDTVLVAQDRALTPQRLGEQRPRHHRMVERGRMELHELEIGDRGTGTHRHRDPVAGRQGRVRRHREHLTGSTRCEHRVSGTRFERLTVVIERDHPDAPSTLDQKIGSEAPLPHLDRVEGPDRRHERPFDLRSGRVSTCVHDPGERVTALPSQREGRGFTVTGTVEHRSQRHEVANAIRPLRHEHPHRVGIAQSRTRSERVGEVELG